MAKFEKGNEIGKETRIKPGEKKSSKYRESYGKALVKEAEKDTSLVLLGCIRRACHVGMNTARAWCREYPQFEADYALARDIICERLQEKALMGETNPKITQFILQNGYGMRDKQEITETVKTMQIDDATRRMLERAAERRDERFARADEAREAEQDDGNDDADE